MVGEKTVQWRPLLVAWALFSTVRTFEPCTELLPIDLLARVLPADPRSPAVQVLRSHGFKGIRFSNASAASFPASKVFPYCDGFPPEFSLVATILVQRATGSQYVFSLVEEGAGTLLVGLRLSGTRLHFLFTPRSARVCLAFDGVQLDDGLWHTLVLAVTGIHASLTIDCGPALELSQSQSFPTSLSTRGSRFYIGCRRSRGRFSGLLRQLVLLPGSDAAHRLCPGAQPHVAELLVPRVLQTSDREQPRPKDQCVRTSESRPPCSPETKNQLWFDTRSLFTCDGVTWRSLLTRSPRLDYVLDYQDLITSSETFDVEVFSLPAEGVFMAAANRDSRTGSGIYRWTRGSFQLHQNISTREARAWKHFSIDSQSFLVVANSGELQPELSFIYRWSRRRRKFQRHQKLETSVALDWEFFMIQNQSFLVVANHRQGLDHNIHSVVYRWNPNTELFEVNQTLSTSGAYDWEFFTVAGFHFLVVANTFDGLKTTINSRVFMWRDGSFQPFQDIPTSGAVDWESFWVDGRFFLVVANSQQVSGHGPSLYSINSTVYELHPLTHTFIRFQDIPTHSAVDWESFTVGEERFLVVANSHDGSSYSLNSVLYRWQGAEGFVPVHRLPTLGCRDWEHFSTSEGSFLVYGSATSRLSKVFKLRTY
ncbi:thrombospondin-type laminin G domain and EAR repeat-containing protein-like isoform X2 [Synchiropus splendidus]|uniref:thrombospondin-type laminin G domain and EAR repeat-containing protein-like isoform X2 n=1 Tax=Synchiropus splendidus TaxID=270530 RepID=UPI00237DEA2E|nr:thrombospondin-type laminin G domain and EAR repeat-containing protein-like isoform X2 [Synchiropus splendidus]